ncbi:MAG: DNA-processing protein DprA [Paracoccaceae bacterium]|nr:DNA-processing protein DprA [Paracoccaceae bacterium]MDP7185880.1 DNA-processing protein DprA [Paracoccaceae bacterium]
MSGTTVSSTHPPLPPTTEDDRVSWLRLLRSRRVGIATFYRLMAEHGSAASSLQALPEIAREAGVENYTPCPEDAALAEMRLGQKAGAQLIFFGQDSYPQRLTDLPDPPPFLWVRGSVASLAQDSIALVGARNASSLGTRMARRLAENLGQRGYRIVSGLARGVDTAAHLGSLETGSIAVMGGGIDVIYPAENAKLAGDILEHGALIAEQAVGTIPQARHFPMRNRLIAALSRAVVVVEAAARSGSLITARNALDQGRDVLVVPGHPMDNRAGGCNMLIRDGATLIRNADDVIEALSPVHAPARQPELPNFSGQAPRAAKPDRRTLRETADLHSQILGRLSPSPIAEDQLIRDLCTPSQRITPALTELELDGKIKRHSGGLLTLCN